MRCWIRSNCHQTKLSIFIGLFFIVTSNIREYSGETSQLEISNPNKAIRDTHFLKRTIQATIYHAIFIDSTDKYKKHLTNFKIRETDSSSYRNNLKQLPALNTKEIISNWGLPSKWISIHKWRDTFYLYYPSDFGYHFRFEINDSTTIEHNTEGPEVSAINQISVFSPSHIVINRTNLWEGKRIDVNIIDAERGIAIFSFGPSIYNEGYQILMVDANKVSLFPVIVNYCKTDRQQEFSFDEIDYKALIESSK